MRPLVPLILALMPAAAQDAQPVQDWIASHAIRLTTVEARHGFSDMQPLKKIIGNARIVSLGEATHGTREFFQLKHRMLEFLVSEMGFSIFSIEANMPEAYRLNDYVLTGRGDPAKLLKGMYFWTWDTEEVLDMIHWMREFNESGKGRVEFTGFDMQIPTVAEQIVADFVEKTDPDFAGAVKSASGMAAKAQVVQGGGSFGVATSTFPVSVAAGKRVRFSGYIKTTEVTDGYAGLWWRVDGASGVLAFDNMQSRGVTGTTDWKEYSIELPVAANAVNINFGALFPGNGSAWFDDLKIELDGKPYEDPSRFDLGFESDSPKGFYTGGNGYRVELDTAVFHGGKQSLRMQGVKTPNPARAAVDPKVAATAWQDIMAHLESSRNAYREKNASARDVDWAIQNARIVVQCMQMRGNQVTRDQSMADNVKWIADHSPDAKIVLWAHNGHVQTGGFGYPAMGSSLRQMFGPAMFAFGFAFNQGSFQAISQSKNGPGTLMDFTVPPAPAGSLDAMLATAAQAGRPAPSVPVFALDLHQVPETGPVADWWNAPHQTRSIGAVYPGDSPPYAFMANVKAREAFDALLFVDKTTAARKNGPLGK